MFKIALEIVHPKLLLFIFILNY